MELARVKPNNLVDNKINRDAKIIVKEDNLEINTSTEIQGYEASSFRYYFTDLTDADMKQTLKSYYSDFFSEEIKVTDNSFVELEDRNKPFIQKSEIKVMDYVKNMGSMKTVKIPFFEKIATLDAFDDEERNYEFNYWEYEYYDKYNTEIIIEIPDAEELIEVPKGTVIKNDFIHYEVKIEQLTDNSIKVTRTVYPNRKSFPAEDYKMMRENVKKIVKAEDIYLVYK